MKIGDKVWLAEGLCHGRLISPDDADYTTEEEARDEAETMASDLSDEEAKWTEVFVSEWEIIAMDGSEIGSTTNTGKIIRRELKALEIERQSATQ